MLVKVAELAAGPYAGSRAIPKFASDGLGSAHYQGGDAHQGTLVMLSDHAVDAAVLGVFQGYYGYQAKGLDAARLKANATHHKKMLVALAALDLDVYDSTSLLKRSGPVIPDAARLARALDAEHVDEAALFKRWLAHLGAGGDPLEFQLEAAREESTAAAAALLLHQHKFSVPAWFVHPALEIPGTVVDAIATAAAGGPPVMLWQIEREVAVCEALVALVERPWRDAARTATWALPEDPHPVWAAISEATQRRLGAALLGLLDREREPDGRVPFAPGRKRWLEPARRIYERMAGATAAGKKALAAASWRT